MKLKHIFTVLTVAALLFGSTACMDSELDEGNITPVNVAAEFGKNNTEGIVILACSLSGSSFDNTLSDETQFTLSFDTPISSAALKKALTIYALSGTNADELYTEAPLDYTITSADASRVLVCSVKLTDQNGIRLFIDSTKLVATDGSKLNKDSDNTVGESGDDDWFKYCYAENPAVGFTGKEIKPLDVKQFLSLHSLVSGLEGYPEIACIWIDIDMYDEGTDYKAIFDNNLYIQYYDLASSSWKKAERPLSFTDGGESGSYHYFTSEIGYLGDNVNTVIRLVTDNIQNFRTSNPLYGYVRRYTLENDEKFWVLDKEEYCTTEDEYNIVWAMDDDDNDEHEFLIEFPSGEASDIEVEDEEGTTTTYGKAVTALRLIANGKWKCTYETAEDNVANYGPDGEHNSYNTYELTGFSDSNASSAAAKLHFFNSDYEEVGTEVIYAKYTQSAGNPVLYITFGKPVIFSGDTIYVYAEAEFGVKYKRTFYTWNGTDDYDEGVVTTEYYTMGYETDLGELTAPYASKVKGMRRLLAHNLTTTTP